MNCNTCGAITIFETTTDAIDLGHCLIIVRNIPCHKCSECGNIIYTDDVAKHLEEIEETSKLVVNSVAIIDYNNRIV